MEVYVCARMTECMCKGICMVYRKYGVCGDWALGFACISSLYEVDFELSENGIHPSVH